MARPWAGPQTPSQVTAANASPKIVPLGKQSLLFVCMGIKKMRDVHTILSQLNREEIFAVWQKAVVSVVYEQTEDVA